MKREGFVLFLTGLPASGKTSLARALAPLLTERGSEVHILDSDELRLVLTPQPTYSPEERRWFYQVIAYLAGLLSEHGIDVLIAASAPRREHREATAQRVDHFGEVFVDCPEEVCRSRDPKDLWERSQEGEITNLPGAGAPYEPPPDPLVRVDTSRLDPERAAKKVARALETRGWLPAAEED